MRKYLVLFFLILLNFSLKAQNENNFSVYLHSGMIVKNWLTPTFPERNPSVLTEFRWAKQTVGKKAWQADFNFPETAISFITGYLGNNLQFGTTFGIVPNISFNSLNRNKWRAHLTLGMGLAYFNHPFDSISNPYNILIGAHITNMSFARIWFVRKISDNLDFRFGFTTIHASDAHYQIPNVGMNIPNLSFAFTYNPEELPKLNYHKDSIVNRRWHANLRAGLGIHEFAETTEPVGTPKYRIYVFSPYASKRLGRIQQLDIGFNFKYYTDFYKFIVENRLFPEHQQRKATVASFFLADELLMNRFAFVMQGALDIYNPFYIAYDDLTGRAHNFSRFVETLTSTRLGLQYYLGDTMHRKGGNAFIGIFVNANFGEADFVEMTTGILL